MSTHAYGDQPSVLQDLHRFDTQSHGHYHVIYRDPEANRRNLERAHRVLCESGFEPVGFAAPHGRWNLGLDRRSKTSATSTRPTFSSATTTCRSSPGSAIGSRSVLQVPIHPVCEGLFFDAGATRGRVVADHLVAVVRARIDAGEPAFVYGHPERRLGRHPEILAALAEAIAGEPLLWRVTLTEFAALVALAGRSRVWSLVPQDDGRFEVQFDDWAARLPARPRGRPRPARLDGPAATARVTSLRLDDLTYERREPSGRRACRLASISRSLSLQVGGPRGASTGRPSRRSTTSRRHAHRPREERPPMVVRASSHGNSEGAA